VVSGVKRGQLQIRVSAQEKARIREAAKRAGLDMSSYVLRCVLSRAADQFQEIVARLEGAPVLSLGLADLNRFLSRVTASELRDAVAWLPDVQLSALEANYLAAMVETACARLNVPSPVWLRGIAPLEEPVFASSLQTLRLHLLTRSPAAYRRRNIFVDSTLGDLV
jgi:uncharacterized protein (DUF1778 family)